MEGDRSSGRFRQSTGHCGRKPTSSREERLAALLAEYVDRLCTGEVLVEDQIREDHPDFADEPIADLESFSSLGTLPTSERPALTFGDYEVRRQVGRGGMGIVYEAHDHRMDRRVALKVLPAEFLSDTRAIARFVKEARIIAKLQHPNIVSVHGLGLERGTPYFVMEYVEGETLAKVLSRLRDTGPDGETPFGKRNDAAYFTRLAAAFANTAGGLGHAHSKGVIHRDLKPSNLILDRQADREGRENGRLRILDFGLARLEGQQSLTRSEEVLGTPSYMSPEQASGPRSKVDLRTDVYGLGATLYEALTLAAPFRGRDPRETVVQILRNEPEPPRKLNPGIPRDLETIVLKCLEKEPRSRYASAEALGRDLRRFAEGDPIEARPLSTWGRMLRRAHRRRWQIAGVLGVFLVAILATIIVRDRLEARRASVARLYAQKVLEALILVEYGRARPPQGIRGVVIAAPGDMRPDIGLEGRGALPRGGGVWELAEVLDSVSRDTSGSAALDRAQALLAEARNIAPERPEALFHLARALRIQGRPDEAAQVIAPALERPRPFAPARIWWETAFLRRDAPGTEETGGPSSERTWEVAYRLAQRALDEKRWEEASNQYSTLLDVYRSSEEPYLGARLEARIGRGTAFLSLRRLDEALEDFATAQAIEPRAPEPLLLLARAYYEKGNGDAAETRLRSLYETTSFKEEAAILASGLAYDFDANERALEWCEMIGDSVERDIRRAQCLCHLDKLDEALAAAERAIHRAPAEPASHFALGKVLAKMGRTEEAVSALRRALEIDEGNVRVHVELGRVFLDAERWVEAEDSLAKALAMDSRRLSALHEMGRLCLERGEAGDLSKARQWFQKSLQIDPRNAVTLNNMGLVLTICGDYQEAIDWYERAIQCKHNNAASYSNLGWAYLEWGKLDRVAEPCQKALRLDPGVYKAHIVLGQLHKKRGTLDEALAEFRKAAAKSPRFWVARFNEGVVLEAMEDLDGAVEAYTKSVEVAPIAIPPLYNLANLHARRGEIEAAIAMYERTLEVDPTHSNAHNNIALVLYRQGKLDRAAEHLSKGIESAPRSPEAYLNLAAIRSEQGRLPEALEALENGVAAVPEDPRLIEQLAYSRERSGDLGLAIESWEQARALFENLEKSRPSVQAYRIGRLLALDALTRLSWVSGKEADARGYATEGLSIRREAADGPKASPENLNDYAWALLVCEPQDLQDPGTARIYAEKAVRLTGAREPEVLDTLALACFRLGEVQLAVKAQRKAIELLSPAEPGSRAAALRKELEERLREFEAAGTESQSTRKGDPPK